IMTSTQQKDRVVWVHGIGNASSGYSLAWRDSFNPYLNFQDNAFIEALWSTIFSATTVFSTALDSPSLVQSSIPLSPTELAQANDLLKTLTNTIQARKSAQHSPSTGEWTDVACRVTG